MGVCVGFVRGGWECVGFEKDRCLCVGFVRCGCVCVGVYVWVLQRVRFGNMYTSTLRLT